MAKIPIDKPITSIAVVTGGLSVIAALNNVIGCSST
jgi:hypothetical protein